MHPVVFITLTQARPAASPRPRPAPSAAVLRADDLYSQRERRRIANYLRLRLDELRRERLDHVVEAIERHLSVDEIIDAGDHPERK